MFLTSYTRFVAGGFSSLQSSSCDISTIFTVSKVWFVGIIDREVRARSLRRIEITEVADIAKRGDYCM